MSSVNPPCTVCNKTIYAEELLKTGVNDPNGKPYAYHKNCFKCAHCGVMRDITSFAQEKGVIYCVQHYKEIFGRRGGYDDLYKGEVKENIVRAEPTGTTLAKPCAQANCPHTRIGGTGVNAIYCTQHATTSAPAASTGPKKVFNLGGGPKCKVCSKSAYPAESIKTGVSDYIYHRSCFKCSYCGTALTISKFSQHEGTLFCEEHFAQLASRAGHYDVTHFKKAEEKADAVATQWGNNVLHK